MTKKQIKSLVRIIIASVGFALCLVIFRFLPRFEWLAFICLYLFIGWDTVIKAIKNIIRGQIFDENFLMVVASIGAIALKEFSEAAAVMLFYKIGNFFENSAVSRSRKSIAALMDLRPDYANLEQNGQIVSVDAEQVNINDIIVIKPGEKIPLDGVVIEGASSIDTSALTGESLPRDVLCGDDVISGCVNINGLIRVKVTREFENSTVSKILDLVENSQLSKAKSENFITKFAKYYTPIVCLIALLVAIVPSVITREWSVWISRALVFLVVSCPCALVISVPLSFFSGIGGASKQGILIKGSNYLEQLSTISTVVFDKTGTLTQGDFAVAEINSTIDENELLFLAAHAEFYSNHPIALAVKNAYGKSIDTDKIQDVEEIVGKGLKATVSGQTVYVGNQKLMEDIGVEFNKIDAVGTLVHIASKDYLGSLIVVDKIKQDAADSINEIKKCNIKNVVMLTGDRKEIAQSVADSLGIDDCRAELLPQDKVDCLCDIMKQSKGVAFIGDGINDAPVLARADLGIAMGAIGSAAAIEAADVVLMDDKLSKIAKAIKISKKTLSIVKQNIVFSLAVKIAVMILSLFGIMGNAAMFLAVFADVGVCAICILNAMRAIK